MKSSDKKTKLFSLEMLGMLLVLFSILGIICLFAGKFLFGSLGENIRGFFLGVFGYLAYVILILTSVIGILVIAGFKIKGKIPAKYIWLTIVIVYLVASIIHLIVTPFKGYNYGTYFKHCYLSGFKSSTIGGILVCFILGLFCQLLKTVGAFLLYFLVLAVIVTILIAKKAKKSAQNKSEEETNSQNNLPNNVQQTPYANIPYNNGVSLPFGAQPFVNNNFNGVSLPFGNANFGGNQIINVNIQPNGNVNSVTFDDVATRLENLKNGNNPVSYQDSLTENTISPYEVPKTNNQYGLGVSGTISSQEEIKEDLSYQDLLVDDSAPNSKMFIPKDRGGDTPYSIKSNDTTVIKPQESSVVSAFDELLGHKKSTQFEDAYIQAKKEQEQIIQDVSLENFELETTQNFGEEESVDDFHDDFTSNSFTYSDPEPTPIVAQSEEEPVSLTYENMKDYDFNPPPLSLFKSYEASEDKVKLQEFFDWCTAKIKEVIKKMRNYDMDVVEIQHGPTFTRFDLSVPIGVPVKDIESLETDMRLHLNTSAVRIAPVPFTNRIGIEVPNVERVTVGLKEVLADDVFQRISPEKCPFVLGKDVTGKSLVLELAELTHILLAGASGSGKSVFVSALLVSLMSRVSPKDLRIIICDPKGVDFISFMGTPHLLIDDIVVERQKIEKVLSWAVQEMERRYSILQEARVSKIAEYNQVMKGKDHMARILIFIDEFADVVGENGKEIMAKVQRLAQKARAAGIHLLLATQRPTVDIVSGTIKSNISTRIALKVQNNQDSRIILEQGGAENLLVHGDMMFFSQNNSQIQRAQGPNISSGEMRDVFDYLRENNKTIFDERLKSKINAIPSSSSVYGGGFNDGADEKDFDLKIRALRFVIESKKTSISAIQREIGVGFNKAATIHDWLIKQGYLGNSLENGKYPILITMDQFKAKFGKI